jgi:hypothetical protein
MNISPKQRAVMAAWADYARVADNPNATESELQAALDEYIEAVTAREDKRIEVMP